MFLGATNKNYDQWSVEEQPANQQTRNCHAIFVRGGGVAVVVVAAGAAAA